MKSLSAENVRIGQRGTLVIPSEFREEYGLPDGQEAILEPTQDGILIKAALTIPLRRYTATEKAEFILRSALTRGEYTEAIAEVKALGVDPKSIPHRPPK